MNAKLNEKSLACWLLIAVSCPQVLAIAPSQAQSKSPISANQTDTIAVASRITDINSSVTGDRLNVTLNFASSDRPQVTYTRQGKSWVALLNGAQLQLGSGNASYAKTNPVPGISAIEATQYAANKVQIRVTANDPAMLKELIKRQDTADSLVFSLEMQPTAVQPNVLTAANAPEAGVVNSQTAADSNQVLVAQNTSSSVGKPLFEPKVTIISADGKTRVAQSTAPNSTPPPVANPVTPQLQGRVPGVVPPFRQIKTPPVGDIATTSSKLRPDIIDLGTAERVPRITLRDAPAIEVLTLIGRVAGLSVVSAEARVSAGGATPAATTGAATGLKQPVSLSIENETAQDVFNSVLRITGLEANRIGQTIFVATKLPLTLKNLITKSYRLNQITVGEASAYLLGLGASRVVNRQRPIPGAQAATVGAGGTVINIPTEAVPTLETITASADSGTSLVLRGLQVLAEERSGSITLIGTPQQVAFAEAQLARLDLRRPQVAVNVRIVDISLTREQTVGSILGFNAAEGARFSSDQGALSINFNNAGAAPSIFTNPQRLFSLITAQITSNNGKVISDPTLVVQEGERGQIDIGNDILTIGTAGKIERSTAGLKLAINVTKIDDNGFITLSILPEVSVIGGGKFISISDDTSSFSGTVDLLTKRSISSGQIRMRDGQSLVLSGVILDSDRETISKVPFLGDLPIIGALFRNSTSSNLREETIIIVTPRIIDDSQNANWGYTYQPGPETQKVLDSNNIKPQ